MITVLFPDETIAATITGPEPLAPRSASWPEGSNKDLQAQAFVVRMNRWSYVACELNVRRSHLAPGEYYIFDGDDLQPPMDDFNQVYASGAHWWSPQGVHWEKQDGGNWAKTNHITRLYEGMGPLFGIIGDQLIIPPLHSGQSETVFVRKGAHWVLRCPDTQTTEDAFVYVVDNRVTEEVLAGLESHGRVYSFEPRPVPAPE